MDKASRATTEREAQMDEPLTRDGVEFKLGMTLVTPTGPQKHTNEAKHRLRYSEEFGKWFISLLSSPIEWDVSYFYSSEAARLSDLIASLEESKANIQAQIDAYTIDMEELCQS